ncbi:MAG: DUF2341 domain-containing protein [Candidatus Woykebacteria bacterium]
MKFISGYLKKICIGFFFVTTLVFILLSYPAIFNKNEVHAQAAGGYGWITRSLLGPASSYTVSVTDASAASITADLIEIWVDTTTGTPTKTCTNVTSCQITPMSASVHRFWVHVVEPGYHDFWGSGVDSVSYSGTTRVTDTTALTTTASATNTRNNTPVSGNWLNYDPTAYNVTLTSPAGGGNITNITQKIYNTGTGITTTRTFAVNNASPYTTNLSAAGLTNGWYGWGIEGKDTGASPHRLAWSSGNSWWFFGIDLSPATVSCTKEYVGKSNGDYDVRIFHSASDTDSTIAQRWLQARDMNGGSWYDLFNTTSSPASPYTFNGVAGHRYEFQYRARNATVDSVGSPAGWSNWHNCGGAGDNFILTFFNDKDADGVFDSDEAFGGSNSFAQLIARLYDFNAVEINVNSFGTAGYTKGVSDAQFTVDPGIGPSGGDLWSAYLSKWYCNDAGGAPCSNDGVSQTYNGAPAPTCTLPNQPLDNCRTAAYSFAYSTSSSSILLGITNKLDVTLDVVSPSPVPMGINSSNSTDISINWSVGWPITSKALMSVIDCDPDPCSPADFKVADNSNPWNPRKVSHPPGSSLTNFTITTLNQAPGTYILTVKATSESDFSYPTVVDTGTVTVIVKEIAWLKTTVGDLSANGNINVDTPKQVLANNTANSLTAGSDFSRSILHPNSTADSLPPPDHAAVSAGQGYVGYDQSSGNNYIRSYLNFNTSGIPQGSEVLAAEISFDVFNKDIAAGNFDVQIVRKEWSWPGNTLDTNWHLDQQSATTYPGKFLFNTSTLPNPLSGIVVNYGINKNDIVVGGNTKFELKANCQTNTSPPFKDFCSLPSANNYFLIRNIKLTTWWKSDSFSPTSASYESSHGITGQNWTTPIPSPPDGASGGPLSGGIGHSGFYSGSLMRRTYLAFDTTTIEPGFNIRGASVSFKVLDSGVDSNGTNPGIEVGLVRKNWTGSPDVDYHAPPNDYDFADNQPMDGKFNVLDTQGFSDPTGNGNRFSFQVTDLAGINQGGITKWELRSDEPLADSITDYITVQDINLHITLETSADFLVVAKDSINGLVSATDWLVEGYGSINTGFTSDDLFGELWSEFGGKRAKNHPTNGTLPTPTAPANGGVYAYPSVASIKSGNPADEANFTWGSGAVQSGNSTVVLFINGALNIESDLDLGNRKAVFIVKKGISVDGQVSTIDGFFVTNKGFDSGIAQAGGPANWYDTDWQFRKKLTVNYSQVNSTGLLPTDPAVGSHSDFPVYVNLADLGSGFFSNVQSDGGDIVVTSGDGTSKLYRELVSIDAGSNTGELWFRAPSLSTSANTELYIYYGNSAANETNDNATWNSGYSMVLHMNGSGTTVADSTGNGNTGTKRTLTTGPAEIDGLIGKAQDFSGADNTGDWVRVTDSNSLDATSALTLEAWIKPDWLGGWKSVVSKMCGAASPTHHSYTIYAKDNLNKPLSQITTACSGGSENTISGANLQALPLNTWSHVGTRYRHPGELMVMGPSSSSNLCDVRYQNSTANIYSSDKDLYIGGNPTWGQEFVDAKIDEVRVSSVARTIGWIKTGCNNQNSPSSFYTIAPAEGGCVDCSLTVNGGVTAWEGYSLGRDLGGGNVTDPSEIFNFDPAYLYYFARIDPGVDFSLLGEDRGGRLEVAP